MNVDPKYLKAGIVTRFIILSAAVTFLTLGHSQIMAQASLPDSTSAPPDLVENYQEVIKKIDVAPVWSAHQIGSPDLFTSEEFQYVA